RRSITGGRGMPVWDLVSLYIGQNETLRPNSFPPNEEAVAAGTRRKAGADLAESPRWHCISTGRSGNLELRIFESFAEEIVNQRAGCGFFWPTKRANTSTETDQAATQLLLSVFVPLPQF